jgi:hypothetical protein
MTPFAILFVALVAIGLLCVPRKWAPLPLLGGACYMTLGQGLQVGPFGFTVIRMIVFVGVIRIWVRHERPAGNLLGLDWLMILWALWALVSSAFHLTPGSALIFRLGLVFNVLGIYFSLRCFCQSVDDVVRWVKVTAILIIPVAIEMLNEQVTGRNLFAVLGGVPDIPIIRDGRLRSQGPFAHSILAGTVGAVCAPLMIGIWRSHARLAKLGLAASLLMVLTSASSGPLMSLLLGGFALVMWKWRHFTRRMRYAAIAGYIFLDIVMKAPAYYLISRIDLTGSSGGWHRAELIDSSIQHLDEWWLAGTDYTRHWMPTGVTWSDDHTDITNYYLHMGVVGGLPLMLLYISILWIAFRYVGQAIKTREHGPPEDLFMIWSLGASLFAHAATSVSVSYWDQSYVFPYACIAMIASVRSGPDGPESEPSADVPVNDPEIATENSLRNAGS